MRISDWSSDVCSSDLFLVFLHVLAIRQRQPLHDDEQRVERADHPPCLAADQLGGVGVALLRYDRSAGGEGIRQRDEAEAGRSPQERKSVVTDRSVSVRVDIGGRRIMRTK